MEYIHKKSAINALSGLEVVSLSKNILDKNRPDWNIGYTTREHLCIDLDNTSYFKTSLLVDMIMQEYPEVGHAIILCSSTSTQKTRTKELRWSTNQDLELREDENINRWIYPPNSLPVKRVQRDNYHVVFNNFIGYEKCCKIIETLALLSVISEAYIKIREMRNDMTLRVSQTVNMQYTKPKPKMLKYVINPYTTRQDEGIESYMHLYNSI